MKKLKLFYFTILIYINSCVAPEQPTLSDNEKKFISEVELKYNGATNRNIDVILLKNDNKNSPKGSYSLNTVLPCEALLKLNSDSIKIQSEAFFLAKKLYTEVLNKNPSYNKIWISFSCDTSSSKYKDLVFVYGIDTLNKLNVY